MLRVATARTWRPPLSPSRHPCHLHRRLRCRPRQAPQLAGQIWCRPTASDVTSTLGLPTRVSFLLGKLCEAWQRVLGVTEANRPCGDTCDTLVLPASRALFASVSSISSVSTQSAQLGMELRPCLDNCLVIELEMAVLMYGTRSATRRSRWPLVLFLRKIGRNWFLNSKARDLDLSESYVTAGGRLCLKGGGGTVATSCHFCSIISNNITFGKGPERVRGMSLVYLQLSYQTFSCPGNAQQMTSLQNVRWCSSVVTERHSQILANLRTNNIIKIRLELLELLHASRQTDGRTGTCGKTDNTSRFFIFLLRRHVKGHKFELCPGQCSFEECYLLGYLRRQYR
jgi:hypothetical protein